MRLVTKLVLAKGLGEFTHMRTFVARIVQNMGLMSIIRHLYLLNTPAITFIRGIRG